ERQELDRRIAHEPGGAEPHQRESGRLGAHEAPAQAADAVGLRPRRDGLVWGPHRWEVRMARRETIIWTDLLCDAEYWEALQDDDPGRWSHVQRHLAAVRARARGGLGRVRLHRAREHGVPRRDDRALDAPVRRPGGRAAAPPELSRGAPGAAYDGLTTGRPWLRAAAIMRLSYVMKSARSCPRARAAATWRASSERSSGVASMPAIAYSGR